jgi:hypothetical protein
LSDRHTAANHVVIDVVPHPVVRIEECLHMPPHAIDHRSVIIYRSCSYERTTLYVKNELRELFHVVGSAHRRKHVVGLHMPPRALDHVRTSERRRK